MKNIAIFASGSGSNAENIIRHFENSDAARISLVVCNRPGAGVFKRAERLGVPCIVIFPRQIDDPEFFGVILKRYEIDYIVLAGFLALVPEYIIEEYRGRIVNIHPALLPKFGGKGMYGDHVHKAVIEAGESVSGITIHHVDEKYDEGDIIAQFMVDVLPEDTPQTLAEKIHALEYEHFPEVIENEIKQMR